MSPDPRPPSRGGTAKAAFLATLELEGAERDRYLADLRAAEPELAERVHALLAAHEGRTASSLESLGGEVRSMLTAPLGAAGAVVGDYELEAELASGASGVVWRARQRSLDRVVALKVLRAGRLAGRREVERFRAEAEAVARFHHPNVVPVYEVGEHEGRHFFSMRLFEGGSLAERIGSDRPWDPRAAARIVRTIARAVHHAHQRGVLHRDLKPSNVLLDERGEPHVADFGVAARIDASGVAAGTATLAGTPAYMAPEQAGGASEELSVATDVWALGCILYELLGGRPPFAGESLAEILDTVRSGAPFPLRALRPDVPRDLETIVLRCLAKDPARRYASANALAVDLERWLAHEPILARRTGPLERLALAWRRSPVAVSLAGTVALLVVALAVGASWVNVALSARLRESLLREARATRLSDDAGRRARALGLCEEAAAIRPGADLRDEAIACLALSDVAPRATLAIPFAQDRSIAVSPDLAVLAQSTDDRGLALRRLPDGEELLRLADPGAGNPVFSPDGRRIAVRHRIDADDETRWETSVHAVATGAELLRLPRGWSSSSIDFTPDGSHLLLGDGDGALGAWRLADGERVLALELGGFASCLGVRGDGAAFAVGVGGDTDALEVRAFPSGELLRSVELPAMAFDVAWLADGAEVVAACGDYAAYRLALDEEEPRLTFTGHHSEVVAVEVSEAAGVVATSSWDRTLRLWDLDTGDQMLAVHGRLVALARDGSTLAYTTRSGVTVADVVHGGVLRSLDGHSGKAPVGAVFTRDAERLVTFGDDRAILWDVASTRPLGPLTDEKTDGVEVAPDGDALYLAWTRGLERRSLRAPFEPGELLFEGDVDHCDLAADGGLLVLRDDGVLRLFDPARPREARVIEGYPGLEFVALGASGAYVAGMTWHGEGLSVWRADGELLGRLREDVGALAVAIAPDERRLVVSDGINYEVYALPSLELERTLPRESAMRESPGTLAFSEDGALFAVGTTQRRIRLHDGRTLEPIATLEARDALFDGRPAFSPDGTLLAVPSTDNRTFVWDLAALRAELEARGIAWR